MVIWGLVRGRCHEGTRLYRTGEPVDPVMLCPTRLIWRNSGGICLWTALQSACGARALHR
jgi:hypothetical protein